MAENNIHVHSFKSTVIPSNCKEKGYTLHKCECGYEHKDNFKPVSSHSFELLEETKPTCTQKGLRTLKCSLCDEIKTFEIDELGHDWDQWNVHTFATCTESGKQTRICKRCGEVEEKVISAKGHKLVLPQKSKNKKGMVEYFCENCGETITMQSKAKRAFKKILLFVILPIILVVALVFSAIEFLVPYYHYSTAKKYIEENKHTRAFHHLTECIDYKDSKELIRDFSIGFKAKDTEIGFVDDGKTSVSRNRSEAKFYKNGNILSNTNYKYDEDNKYIGKNVYEYDEKGNLTLYAEYNEEDGWESKNVYEYNKNGDQTLYAFYINGGLSSKTVTEYNKKGDKILTKRYDGKELTFTTTYKHEYDSKGNKISSTYGDLRFEYEYYNNGKLKAETEYNSSGQVVSISKYNKEGIKTYYAYSDIDDDGVITDKTEKVYNKYGSLISYKSNDEEIEFSYKYDEFDNPIQCTFDDGKQEWEYDEYGKLTSYKLYRKGKLVEKSRWKYDYEKEELVYRYESYLDGELDCYFNYEASGMVAQYAPDVETRVDICVGDPFEDVVR